MSAHTPAPWAVNAVFPDAGPGHTFEPSVSITGMYEGRVIRLADIPDVASQDSEEMANAKLMACAPELATALEYVIASWDERASRGQIEKDIDDARAVLRKALWS